MTRARELADLLTGGQTITTADNSAQLTLESTDADASVGPLLDMIRDSASPANDDTLGRVRFRGDNNAGEAFTYGTITSKITDATDGTEGGLLTFLVGRNGSVTSALDLNESETVFNEGGLDANFRVEGDSNANLFFVDAGNDKIGVGTNTPAAIFSALSATGTTTDIGRFEAAVGSYTGTSLVAANTLGAASSFNLFKCISDSDADAGGPVTHFLVRGDGLVGIGASTVDRQLHIEGSRSNAYSSSDFDNTYNLVKIENPNTADNMATGIQFLVGSNGSAAISATRTGDGAASLCFGTRGGGSRAERMRITDGGALLVGLTSPLFSQTIGLHVTSSSAGSVAHFNRSGDGGVVRFGSDGTEEGSISISGTATSLVGGHLSRWSQATDGNRIDGLVKGTVMTNLDQMAVWHHKAQAATFYEDGDNLMITPDIFYEEGDIIPDGKKVGDLKTAAVYAKVGDEKTPAVDAYDEDNEQLNCMAVSSVEGDVNVAGVFVNWDDDEVFTADMIVAMTGDMVIRIAKDTTVERGNLLMSAGDGTAKPQGDGYVQDKTIAKVTSTKVSHTYDDGSYLVPCVLMAC